MTAGAASGVAGVVISNVATGRIDDAQGTGAGRDDALGAGDDGRDDATGAGRSDAMSTGDRRSDDERGAGRSDAMSAGE